MGQVVEVPIAPAASWIARQLVEQFFLSHGLLIPDALIAASALEHALPLYTRNVRHFQPIRDLTATAPY